MNLLWQFWGVLDLAPVIVVYHYSYQKFNTSLCAYDFRVLYLDYTVADTIPSTLHIVGCRLATKSLILNNTKWNFGGGDSGCGI